MMSKTNIRHGMVMLMSLKEAALSAELGDEFERALCKATGCGMLTLACYIDNILKALLDTQTELANYKFQYGLSHEVEKQWNGLGFCEAPEDMSEEQKAELRAVAKRFYVEDGEEG